MANGFAEQPDWQIRTDAPFYFARKEANGHTMQGDFYGNFPRAD